MYDKTYIRILDDDGKAHLTIIIGVGTVGAVGAIAPPLISEEFALFPRADM